MWARPGRNTRTAPSTSANWEDFSGKVQKLVSEVEPPKQIRSMWQWGCTYVSDELDQQVHVDLIRVHELQHLPSSVAEVIKIRTEFPARPGVSYDQLLEQTHVGYKDRDNSPQPRCTEDVTWCWNVVPPFCVTETVISSSSSRIFWLYSESFSSIYPVSSTMSSKWDTWKQAHNNRCSGTLSIFTAAPVLTLT